MNLGVGLSVALLLAGCPRNAPELAHLQNGAETAPPEFLSSVHMADARRTERQLLKGFHRLEQGVWRWTARKFSAGLLPPPDSGGNDVQLEFHLVIPEIVISRLGAVTLSARMNGTPLGNETFAKPGEYRFVRPVPAGGLQEGEVAKIEFELDKAFWPDEPPKRELGVIAVSVALK
jgi:hypothetical protein